MAGDQYDYEDMYDGIFLPLNTDDPSRAKERMVESLKRKYRFRESLVGQFRMHQRSKAFRERVRCEETRDHVSAYFTHRHRMRYLKTMHSKTSNGLSGASLFAQFNEDGTERRRLVVKYCMDESRGKNEAEWLQRFAGVDHIVNLVPLEGEAQNASGGAGTPASSVITLTSSTPKFSAPPVPGAYPDPGNEDFEEPSINIGIPMMVLEYMEGGDLNEVRQRCKDQDIEPPDRFLWAVSLCLMRAFVGMAFYYGMVAGKKERPHIHEANITHGSIDLSQVLVGPLLPDDEHGLIPLFKLCGFAYTATLDGGGGSLDGIAENLRGMGRIIETLAHPESMNTEHDTGLLALESWNYTNHDGEAVETDAHEDFHDSDNVSTQLEWLVCQQLASDSDDVPSLQYCLYECEKYIDKYERGKYNKQTAVNNPEMIAEFVKDVVLNAPVSQPVVKESKFSGIVERIPGIIESTRIMMERISLGEDVFRRAGTPQ